MVSSAPFHQLVLGNQGCRRRFLRILPKVRLLDPQTEGNGHVDPVYCSLCWHYLRRSRLEVLSEAGLAMLIFEDECRSRRLKPRITGIQVKCILTPWLRSVSLFPTSTSVSLLSKDSFNEFTSEAVPLNFTKDLSSYFVARSIVPNVRYILPSKKAIDS